MEKRPNFQNDKQTAEFFRKYALDYTKEDLWGLAKHFYIIACEVILKNRKNCPKKKEREKIAQKLINEAKMIKAKITERLNRILASDHQAKVINESVLEKPLKNCGFENIIGQKSAKEHIMECLIYPSKRPDIFKDLRAPAKGILLYGPPGNGKTMLARAIACECQAKFFNLSSSSILSKYVGESQKMIRALFKLARLLQPSIIFIDEIDSLLCSRSEGEADNVRQIKTEFLLQFEGVATSKNEWVFVIGATNRPYDLDSAVLRRFPKKVLVDTPTLQDRVEMIQLNIQKIHNTLKKNEVKIIAKALENFSASDIITVIKEASMMPIRGLGCSVITTNINNVPPVTKKDFLKAIDQISPCASQSELKKLRKWGKSNS